MKTYGGNPPCEECPRPELLPENRLAVRAWQICHVMGREGMAGIMQAANVVAVLQMLGGDELDLEKVMVIEEVYQRLRAEKDGKRPENSHRSGR